MIVLFCNWNSIIVNIMLCKPYIVLQVYVLYLNSIKYKVQNREGTVTNHVSRARYCTLAGGWECRSHVIHRYVEVGVSPSASVLEEAVRADVNEENILVNNNA